MTYFEVMNAIKEMVDAGAFNYIDYINLVDMNIWTSLMFWFSYSVVCTAVILPAAYFVKKIVRVVKDIKYEIEEGEMNY